MKTNVVEYLIDTKNKYPNKIALEDENFEITFNDLYLKSTYISSNILSSTPPPIRKY